jgi:hypothetical protein
MKHVYPKEKNSINSSLNATMVGNVICTALLLEISRKSLDTIIRSKLQDAEKENRVFVKRDMRINS